MWHAIEIKQSNELLYRNLMRPHLSFIPSSNCNIYWRSKYMNHKFHLHVNEKSKDFLKIITLLTENYDTLTGHLISLGHVWQRVLIKRPQLIGSRSEVHLRHSLDVSRLSKPQIRFTGSLNTLPRHGPSIATGDAFSTSSADLWPAEMFPFSPIPLSALSEIVPENYFSLISFQFWTWQALVREQRLTSYALEVNSFKFSVVESRQIN